MKLLSTARLYTPPVPMDLKGLAQVIQLLNELLASEENKSKLLLMTRHRTPPRLQNAALEIRVTRADIHDGPEHKRAPSRGRIH